MSMEICDFILQLIFSLHSLTGGLFVLHFCLSCAILSTVKVHKNKVLQGLTGGHRRKMC